MIAFGFDRAKIRHRLSFYASIVFGGLAVVVFLAFCIMFYTARNGWPLGFAAIMAALIIVELHLAAYARWVGRLRIGMKKRSPAIVVDRLGIVDNASDYALGQLAWTEIKKIYSRTLVHRMFGSRWRRMPIISKFRGVVVVLKDEANLQDRLQVKHWSIRYAFKEQFKRGRKRWLFIPEMLLDTSADELMQRLNAYYVAQVRAS